MGESGSETSWRGHDVGGSEGLTRTRGA